MLLEEKVEKKIKQNTTSNLNYKGEVSGSLAAASRLSWLLGTCTLLLVWVCLASASAGGSLLCLYLRDCRASIIQFLFPAPVPTACGYICCLSPRMAGEG